MVIRDVFVARKDDDVHSAAVADAVASVRFPKLTTINYYKGYMSNTTVTI